MIKLLLLNLLHLSCYLDHIVIYYRTHLNRKNLKQLTLSSFSVIKQDFHVLSIHVFRYCMFEFVPPWGGILTEVWLSSFSTWLIYILATLYSSLVTREAERTCWVNPILIKICLLLIYNWALFTVYMPSCV